MARTGDFITPRLDGQPWFEKPPLTYWLVAIGPWARLSDEWAARLPMALIGAGFLIFFYRVLAREFSPRLALSATAILASTAGWAVYSFACLTDLPMSAALGASMLIALFETRTVDHRTGETADRGWVAGVLLGLAILGKGFVPVVLFAPVLLIARGKRLGIVAGAVAVAAPWHLLCWMKNGNAFWNDYFWKQHIARFFTPELEHVQPFWYYIPVLLAGTFPWTPLFGLVFRPKLYDDVRVRLMAAWIGYGLIFFSAATNKLPGYLLPLMPAVAIVLAAAVDKATGREWWLTACTLLLVIVPTAGRALPVALSSGLRRSSIHFVVGGLIFVAAAGLTWFLSWKQGVACGVTSVAIAAGVGIVVLKLVTFPVLDREVSVRAFWRAHAQETSQACLDRVPRALEYGLNFYAGYPIPACGAGSGGSAISISSNHLTIVPKP